jgi:hypothetical protein
MGDVCYIVLVFTIKMVSLNKGAKLNGLIIAESMLQFTEDSRQSGQEIFILVVAKTEGQTERIGGQWLCQCEKFYGADGKFLGGLDVPPRDEQEWDSILQRQYGEHWSEYLVTTMQNFRLG